MNWVKGMTRQRFNELLVWIRPAYMQVLHGRSLPSGERDIVRSELLRSHIAKLRLDTEFFNERHDETPDAPAPDNSDAG